MPLGPKEDPFRRLEDQLPGLTRIRALKLAELESRAKELERLIGKSGLRWYLLSHLKGYPKITALLDSRNRKLLAAAKRSPLWERTIRRLSSQTQHWVPKRPTRKTFLSQREQRLEKVPLDISFKDAEKAFMHVLKQYDRFICGYSPIIKSSKGEVKRITLSGDEGQPEMIFYNVLLKLRRSGKGPVFSADQIPAGTVLTGKDGRRYAVAGRSRPRRWVLEG
jgi:hypothetical protein